MSSIHMPPGDAPSESLAEAWAHRAARDHGLPFVDLRELQVSPLVAELLPEAACRELLAAPIGLDDGVVTVAVANPAHPGLEERLVSLLGHPVALQVAPGDALESALDARFDPGAQVPVARPMRQSLLGDVLITHGAVSAAQIDTALHDQEVVGGRLGEILLHQGIIDETQLLTALSELHGIPAVDLGTIEPEPEALAAIPEPLQRELRIVPLLVHEGVLWMASADVLTADSIARLEAHTAYEHRELLARASEIDLLQQRIYNDAYSRTAVHLLRETNPQDSGDVVFTKGQLGTFAGIAIALLVFGIFSPILMLTVLVGALGIFHLAVSLYKLRLVLGSLGEHAGIEVTEEEVAALDVATLPVYTILVPLFREAAVVPALVKGVHSLDYPRHKLDVRLLCEEEDEETIDAIRALDLPPHFHLVIVPPSLPQTKPKACNFGLLQATGEITVIYDAEDRPDRDQLKRAIAAFRKSPDTVACIQAKLNYFNSEQNLLTRWFTTEYSMWFDLMLPGLDKRGAPIPLGGTSNHFKTEELLKLGAWDPYNVTEDADLGIRLHKAGLSTAVIDSTTFEEANSDLPNWIRQRSRWIKGYLQTYLVHMRNPVRLFKQMGFRGFLSFQLVVGGTLTFLINPIFWALTTVFTLTQLDVIRQMFPGFLFYFAIAQLVIGNFVFIYANIAGTIHRGYFRLVRHALFSPLYWGFMSIAAWKGFWQLIVNPFYWEKTEHGLDAVHTTGPPVQSGTAGEKQAA
ncbi:glycosyltransferase family 2 protein [Patulibacter sp. NPDC049589]|uniref:GspE/PulE/PilB domain-containing protein n=1 Tax=Patulibacter sp. NPDC049589 TaxID=3154731 RepID=UPI0034125AB8